MSKYIDALLQERAGCERRGLTDRVKKIDLALKDAGFSKNYESSEAEIETASVQPEVEKTVLKRGKKKKA